MKHRKNIFRLPYGTIFIGKEQWRDDLRPAGWHLRFWVKVGFYLEKYRQVHRRFV